MCTKGEESSSSSPLPLEIYGMIIDTIANEGSEPDTLLSVKAEALSTLQSCSLVCLKFGYLTRPHLFRCAKIGFDDGTRCKERMDQLVGLLKQNSTLAGHLRDLHLEYEVIWERGFTLEDQQRCANIICDLPNIQSIKLYYPASSDDDSERKLFASVVDRILDLFAVKKHQLRSLHARVPFSLPLPMLFQCDTLQSISIHRCGTLLPNLSAPVTHLTSLTLFHFLHSTPLSFLLNFPNLVELKVKGCVLDCDVGPKTAGHWHRPPLGLISMSVYPFSSEYVMLVNFFRTHAEKHGINPFNTLETLKFGIDVDISSNALSTFLSWMPALKHLCVTFSRQRNSNPLQIQHPGVLNLSALQSLTMKMSCMSYSGKYDHVVDHFSRVLSILTPSSSLRRITLQLNIMVKVTPRDETPVWGILLRKLLHDCFEFRKLRGVILELRYRFSSAGFDPRALQESGPPTIPTTGADPESRFSFKSHVADAAKEDAIVVQKLRELHVELLAGRPPGEAHALGVCVVRIDGYTGGRKHYATAVFGSG